MVQGTEILIMMKEYVKILTKKEKEIQLLLKYKEISSF